MCAHVVTRAGYEMAEIEAMLSELESKGRATRPATEKPQIGTM
jgi:hypothetical protein